MCHTFNGAPERGIGNSDISFNTTEVVKVLPLYFMTYSGTGGAFDPPTQKGTCDMTKT